MSDQTEAGRPGAEPAPAYEFLEVLGRGGMGVVHKAFEPELNRFVAVKVLHYDSPEQVERLMREARSQARLTHDNICRVYRVDRIGGRPCIVMQYIDGKPLSEVVGELSLEQKVRILAKVADAMHEAHREGLIHRDLKPGNLMMERDPDGDWKPYVLDFGLVQELGKASLTRTGEVMGTPRYMAPEQAVGNIHALDRRTDVYALGAILYEMLSGKYAHEGETAVEILLGALHSEPRPLRGVAPNLPADLETITMKCLERDPARRYESARALAEDLRRFLDGEPILARKASLAYRLVRKARKHRGMVALTAVFLVVLAVLVGIGARMWWKQSERAALARQFGQEVERMEWLLRYARVLPLHDTRREMGLVRSRMSAIEQRMSTLGDLAAGPGGYALGRGCLALGEWERARGHLEKAWADDYRDPEVACALGLCLSELYRRELGEAQRISNPDLRKAQVERLESEYRKPTLEYLRLALASPGVQPAYVEGLIALQEKRYDAALASASHVLAADPWFYEARKLQGDIHRVVGREAIDSGELARGEEELRRAGKAYEDTVAIARSDASAYDSMALLCIDRMVLESLRGGPVDGEAAKALAAAGKALAAQPDRPGSLEVRTTVYLTQAQQGMRAGKDCTALLEAARRSAERVLAVDPRRINGYNHLGTASLMQALYVDLPRGKDPRGGLARAAQAFDRALALDPDHLSSLVNRGAAFAARSEYEMSKGIDPVASFDQAQASYERITNRYPQATPIFNNLANVYLRRGDWESAHGQDPRPTLQVCLANCERAVAANPAAPQPRNLHGAAWVAIARYECGRGQDPSTPCDRALKCFEEALARNPAYHLARNNVAETCVLRGNWEHAAGRDALPWAKRAREAAEAVIATQPSVLWEIHYNAGNAEFLAARCETDAARRQAALSLAHRHLEKALEVNPRQARIFALQAEIDLFAASRPGTPAALAEKLLQSAGENLARGLAIKPGDVDLNALRGFACLCRAASLPGKADAASEIGRGRDAVREVQGINLTHPLAQAVDLALSLREQELGGNTGKAAEFRERLTGYLRRHPLLEEGLGPFAASRPSA